MVGCVKKSSLSVMCFSQKSVKFLLLKQIHQPEDVFEVDTVVGHY